MQSVTLLADANNFYASCEAALNPRLVGKPLLVLSNNDGCIVARSREARQLGFKMGQPLLAPVEYSRSQKQSRRVFSRILSAF